MSPDPSTANATPSASPAPPATKTFLVALTKRGKDHDGKEVTAIALALRQRVKYRVNFREKGQDEVHAKLEGSDVYAVFRFDGTWTCKGVIMAGGQPTSAPPADITFALYALLIHRKDAKLEDRVVKPDPYALVRKITDEERQVCKRIGRPPDLRSRAAYLAVQPLLRLIKEEPK